MAAESVASSAATSQQQQKKGPFQGHFRILVLIVATVCIAMMMANILTLNFTLVCMTEERARYENFSINLGFGSCFVKAYGF
jgi:hypothetical protein